MEESWWCKDGGDLVVYGSKVVDGIQVEGLWWCKDKRISVL